MKTGASLQILGLGRSWVVVALLLLLLMLMVVRVERGRGRLSGCCPVREGVVSIAGMRGNAERRRGVGGEWRRVSLLVWRLGDLELFRRARMVDILVDFRRLWSGLNACCEVEDDRGRDGMLEAGPLM